MNNNLQRMIVIPPEVFEKWKHIITEDQNLSTLDKHMKNILYNKNLNNVNKWHQYREKLLKYSFAKPERKYKYNHILKPITSEKVIQTKRIPKYHKQQQTENQNRVVNDKQMQTDSGALYEDEVYENIVSSDASNSNDCDNDNDEDNVFPEDIRQLALKGVPKHVKITKERRSTDPDSYSAFELSDGQVVSVPTMISKRTTRSMKKIDSINENSSPLLRQSKLKFKKVKAPTTRPRSTLRTKSTCKSPSKSSDQNNDLVKWVQYK